MERRIAYTSPFVPAEWIAAFGLSPFRVLPAGGASREEGLPRGACPFAHAFAREVEALARAGRIRGAVFATTCDQMRRAAEALDAPGSALFVFNVPHTWKTPAAAGLYLEELKRLGRFLVGLGGKEPAREALVETCLRFDRERRALLEGRQLGRGIPIALLGGPLWGEHRGIYGLVERSGGSVALDWTEWGERTLPAPFRRRFLLEDPLLELGEAYFGSIPAPFRRPNSMLYAGLSGEIRSRGIRGILLVRPLSCDFWQAEAARLAEWSSLPVVDVDLAGEAGSMGRAESRIQALMELLR